jgi:hypothetical protein
LNNQSINSNEWNKKHFLANILFLMGFVTTDKTFFLKETDEYHYLKIPNKNIIQLKSDLLEIKQNSTKIDSVNCHHYNKKIVFFNSKKKRILINTSNVISQNSTTHQNKPIKIR